MVNGLKPREFWIRRDPESVDPDKLTHMVNNIEIYNSLHVIEYSAYAALEAKLKIAVEALEGSNDTICGEFCSKEHHQLCKKVTSDIEKIGVK